MPMTITETTSLLEMSNLKERLFFRMETLYEEIQEKNAAGKDTTDLEEVWKSLLENYNGQTLTLGIVPCPVIE